MCRAEKSVPKAEGLPQGTPTSGATNGGAAGQSKGAGSSKAVREEDQFTVGGGTDETSVRGHRIFRPTLGPSPTAANQKFEELPLTD